MTPNELAAVRFREALGGYSASAVDALLEQVNKSIQAAREPRPMIEAARLPRAIRGYSTRQVNAFLSELSGIPENSAP